MNANFFQAMTSSTAAATIDGFDERSRHPSTFEVAEDGASAIPREYSASAAFQRLGGRAIRTATAKNDIFAIAVNRGHDRGFVVVDLERGALCDRADAGGISWAIN